MDYLQILILALIQGAAELLPVSSSAHVILAQKLMGRDPSKEQEVFLLVMLHTGTMFAVLVYFWKRWKALIVPPEKSGDGVARSGLHFPKMVVLATAITGVLGLAELAVLKALGHEPEHLFKNLPLIGTSLLLVGLVIIAAGTYESGARATVLGVQTAAVIGLVQGLLLPFRGFSRSGATISTGLFCGVSRSLAEDFSFALAVLITPPVQVYSLYKLLKKTQWQWNQELAAMVLPGLVGMAFSFLAGLAALRFLSAALESGRWKFFGYYCIGFALVVFGVALAGY
jgi:undecaprenyl-diphosphatase